MSSSTGGADGTLSFASSESESKIIKLPSSGCGSECNFIIGGARLLVVPGVVTLENLSPNSLAV